MAFILTENVINSNSFELVDWPNEHHSSPFGRTLYYIWLFRGSKLHHKLCNEWLATGKLAKFEMGEEDALRSVTLNVFEAQLLE